MIVAVTGVILILFVVGHLLGNLQIFLGPEWINGYAEHLRDLGPLLWVIRGFLLVVVIAHIYYTIRLAIENRGARPEHYKRRNTVKATLTCAAWFGAGITCRMDSGRRCSFFASICGGRFCGASSVNNFWLSPASPHEGGHFFKSTLSEGIKAGCAESWRAGSLRDRLVQP
jgi:succinate dehydrogenase/fumarate reductase cytochrome b subunit